MKVETVKVEMDVPKEGKEVVDCLDAVLEKVLAKAPVTSYLELIDDLSKAADGAQKLAAEAQSEYRDELSGYLVQKLMARLVPAKPAAE